MAWFHPVLKPQFFLPSQAVEAQNAKKAKLFSRIGKEVVSAVKKGGPNIASNPVLAAVLEKAKELDVPKDIVERNIKRASEKGQEAYIEKIYEVGMHYCYLIAKGKMSLGFFVGLVLGLVDIVNTSPRN
ncbi:hypothetical protein RIF29_14423 [Crotalaria pallida]|uniref:TACO1/YebC-like N-terminal domain-containing protein n=1 Tax=Crotalaria pallida TaxID=3830 RepID=A0AAN9FBN0_CROPI